MAGLIVNLGEEEALERYCTSGAYSTRLPRPAPGPRGWGAPGEGTIADFLAIRPGDAVLFFVKRHIYGVGEIVQLPNTVRPALCNFRRSWDLRSHCFEPFLWDNEPDDLADHPFVIFFRPSPAWWRSGIDMDEALTSDVHGYVSALPFFWRVSFARIDDLEVAHIVSLLARYDGDTWADRSAQTLQRAQSHMRRFGSHWYEIDIDELVRAYASEGQVRHEALIEAWMVDAMVRADRWRQVREALAPRHASPYTYVGRQVPASPFKPPDYADRIDILAYDIAPPPGSASVPIKRDFLAIEVKKGAATIQDVVQLMKYVDWLAHTKQGGEYHGIRAVLVAARFAHGVIDEASELATRSYIRPRRPYRTEVWSDLHLVRYSLQSEGPALSLEPAWSPSHD